MFNNEKEPQEKVGFFSKLKAGLNKTRDALNEKVDSVLKVFKKIDEELYEELEEALIMADVGVNTSMYIIEELRKVVKEKHLTESEQVKEEIAHIMANILGSSDNSLNTETTPSVIMVIGVNGVGKTTSIGKLAAKFKNKQVSCIAGDTFRAAAVEQLSIWAERNNIRVHKGENGCDTAALCFDGLQEAIKQKDDIVFIDTAGRLQNKTNLIEELQKIVRVIKKVIPQAPHHTLLCLDATTGQNALDQVKTFRQMIDVNGLIINKLDGTAKGGILAAIATECPIPVYFIGVGESIDDMDTFSAQDFANGLLDIN